MKWTLESTSCNLPAALNIPPTLLQIMIKLKLQFVVKTLSKLNCRRKSRAIIKRRYTQDGDVSQEEVEGPQNDEESLDDVTVALPVKFKRRATRSVAPKIVESPPNVQDEASVEDSVEPQVEEHMEQNTVSTY